MLVCIEVDNQSAAEWLNGKFAVDSTYLQPGYFEGTKKHALLLEEWGCPTVRKNP